MLIMRRPPVLYILSRLMGIEVAVNEETACIIYIVQVDGNRRC